MLNVYKVIENSQVDGPGRRVTVFTQGCPIACPGCQNVHLWPSESKNATRFNEDEFAGYVARLAEDHDGVTISGGDPFFQPQALAYFVRALRKHGVKNIIVYTGYTFDELIDPLNPAYLWVREILPLIDVLVDGPFIKALDHGLMNFRGSSNQRPIDVQATLKAESLVVLDWDTPELEISPEGDVFFPIDLAKEFAEFGQAKSTRMCGQTITR